MLNETNAEIENSIRATAVDDDDRYGRASPAPLVVQPQKLMTDFSVFVYRYFLYAILERQRERGGEIEKNKYESGGCAK